jgi:hypothetical protein
MWQFVTGDQDEIYDIGQNSYMVTARKTQESLVVTCIQEHFCWWTSKKEFAASMMARWKKR